ncbi:hypothetical protein, partial [Dokdonella sp.]|uniref:hypothetical protein n=1 Tax=Dokdonella sp. TaxID=2291710 RepID=UPI0027B8E9B3
PSHTPIRACGANRPLTQGAKPHRTPHDVVTVTEIPMPPRGINPKVCGANFGPRPGLSTPPFAP